MMTTIWTSRGQTRRDRRVTWSIISAGLAVLLAAGVVGCDDTQFSQADRQEVRKVFQTGVDRHSDPFVQAETLRVFELIDQPALTAFARPLVGPEHPPMVRVEALRVLMAGNAEDVRRLAIARFDKAGVAEQAAILDAVYEFGSPPLKRVVTGRALRSDDPGLQRKALLKGPIERLARAEQAGKTSYVHNSLIPQLGRYVTVDDEVLAAAALEALVEAGQPERAQPILEILRDQSAQRDDRLAAARILGRAGVHAAVPAFESIMDAADVSEDDPYAVPEQIDKPLVRAAILGLVATGQTQYVRRAQHFLKNADARRFIEVLNALASNPDEDAVDSVKIAMQDARKQVRQRAIELYSDRQDAAAMPFIAAMKVADSATQKRLANILIERFPRQWAANLSKKLSRQSQRLPTLELLRDVVVTADDAAALKQLSEPLSKIVKSSHHKARPLAALMLAKVNGDAASRKILASVPDSRIRYGYLEYLVRTSPSEHVDDFRDHLYSDLYAIRLMSAAGLLVAYDTAVGVDDRAAQ